MERELLDEMTKRKEVKLMNFLRGLNNREQEQLFTDLEDMTSMHDGKKLTELYPQETTEDLATRAKRIVELQEQLRNTKSQ